MNVLKEGHWGVVTFCALFGVLFIVIGIRRALVARTGENVTDSILWGGVGIAIGLAFFFGAYWIASPAVSH